MDANMELNYDGPVYYYDSTMQWGQILHFPYLGPTVPGEDLVMKSIQFPIDWDDDASGLAGRSIDIKVYQWIDADGDGDIDDSRTELLSNEKGGYTYTFPAGVTTDANGMYMVETDLVDIAAEPGIKIDPESVYWVSVRIEQGDTIGLYSDNTADNSAFGRFPFLRDSLGNVNTNLQPGNLLIGASSHYSGWSNAGPWAMMLKLATKDQNANITDIDQNLNITTYPNPATEYTNLEVKSPNVQDFIAYTLTDITGRVIAEDRQENVAEAAFNVNMSSIPSGAYIIKVQTPEGFNSKKVTKK